MTRKYQRTSISVLFENIKNRRKQLCITQLELSELVRTSYKYIQRIESKNPPDIRVSTVERIAKSLKIEPGDLFKKCFKKI